MKAIIAGKRYDTASAELIGEAENGGNWSDFSHWEAGLYPHAALGLMVTGIWR